jgi:hypothetical protein
MTAGQGTKEAKLSPFFLASVQAHQPLCLPRNREATRTVYKKA